MIGRYDIPLDWYGIFVAVARTGSITQAAEHLFLTQPAVSMAVKQLEARLGHALFIRSARGVALTPEGQTLYSYLDRAMGLIDAAERKYREMERLEAGSIAIGASDTLCSQYLLSYLEEYNRRFPHIAVKVTNRTSPETINILKSGEVDFGFVNLPLALDDGLDVTECLTVHDCLVCGEKYRELCETAVTLEELKRYPLLMLERSSATRRYLDQFAAAQGARLEPILELGSSDLLVKFARINLGLAFVIREFTLDALNGSSLFEVPLNPPPPPRSVGLVRLKNLPLSFAAEEFVKMIIKQNK